ncbi:MAG TPA: hypothetical protein DCL80_03890 [Balneola sp.]|jgi:hypothetical protein|nr:hypothetical protein [Balneola sp.]MAO77332.1 hypothetical protein [Balneola sp.]HAH50435.1 hypothetical protein [Balneola sp.]HBZ39571.1 hypothetical protein [Balneola sp.]|tara:strand:+ start:4094 stop:4411 length:318 start_codon:yes stop_codon:yes gene_type:complete
MSEDVNKSLGLEETSKSENKAATQKDLNSYLIASLWLYGIAVILVIVGFITGYKESTYDNSIVNGDAYNYIIFATRGVIWIGTAILVSIIGFACQIKGHVIDLYE